MESISTFWIFKFQERIFTAKKFIQLWNFSNFGMPKIIPKSPVTLRFSKVSLHELKGICKCFQMRYWPNFYVDPTYSNTCFFKVGKRRVLLQGTVYNKDSRVIVCPLVCLCVISYSVNCNSLYTCVFVYNFLFYQL